MSSPPVSSPQLLERNPGGKQIRRLAISQIVAVILVASKCEHVCVCIVESYLPSGLEAFSNRTNGKHPFSLLLVGSCCTLGAGLSACVCVGTVKTYVNMCGFQFRAKQQPLVVLSVLSVADAGMRLSAFAA